MVITESLHKGLRALTEIHTEWSDIHTHRVKISQKNMIKFGIRLLFTECILSSFHMPHDFSCLTQMDVSSERAQGLEQNCFL